MSQILLDKIIRLILQKKEGVYKVVNFKDFPRPNKDIKYFSKPNKDIKYFSRPNKDIKYFLRT